ncbi:S8 family serine peptidase [Phormidium sp. CCY1219]|uniref:S8 family serine peptidase n=1 Tax=Phormidium sp. CCY1219 TaxID=2886104 RepID=UPI002D1ECD2E|nr:S8 family serine peptidase [Phormidium sp. CCY1219]MEB3827733.1 S8 family serine peptidase [Phormidium sp. CCY1219]
MLDISSLFDESYYLQQNPDVLGAVNAGSFSNGLDHFLQVGQYLGTDPSGFFDTDYYLEVHPDVEAAVIQGETTAIAHFATQGKWEERDPFAEFDSDVYLAENPDVAAAVERDELTGIDHFVAVGQYEGRDPGPNFDTEFYLEHNPDVAAAVRRGELSAIEHYLELGKTEGRAAHREEFAAIAPNDNPDLSRIGSLNFTGFIGPANSRDIYSFHISTPSNFNLALNNLSADADVGIFKDYNGNHQIDFGELVNISENSGTSPESLERTLNPGNYFVVVEQYRGETGYNLSLSATELSTPVPDAAGNSLLQALDIGVLQDTRSFSDFVGNADSLDLYRFQVNTPSRLEIDLSGLSADADVFLVQDLNNDGQILHHSEIVGSSVEPGPSAETIRISTLTPNTDYYVAVEQYEGDTSYTLTLSATPIAPNSPTSITSLPNFDSRFGFGMVDASAAVAQALGESIPFADVANPVVNNYGVDLVKAPEVWNRGYTGSGVVVAVLDTGIDLQHHEFQGKLWVNEDEIPNDGIDNDGNGYVDDRGGYDFADGDPDPSNQGTQEEHGTHVAGIIAASRTGVDANNGLGQQFEIAGVAYNATIMPVRVLNNRQTFSEFDTSVAQGIRYAVENGAQVINLSLGNFPDEPPTEEIAAALRFARDRGVVVAIASGNEGDTGAVVPADPAIRATEDLAIAVGAIDRDRRVASFSNPASNALGTYDFIVAPGVQIPSSTPNNTYSSSSGTSMAAPYVSGVAALMLQANPNLTPPEVETILTRTADSTGIIA